MKVKDILKRYIAANNGKIEIEVTTGAAKGLHVVNMNGIDGLLERRAPITELNVGLIYVVDNELKMTAH